MRRLTRHSLPVLALLMLVAGNASAADPEGATAHRAKDAHQPRTRSTATESEAARREREHRQDLERRVERLEQLNELKNPTMPPADPPH